MNKIEDIVEQGLLNRGFSKETILNNRGLIGASIEETIACIERQNIIPFIFNLN